VEGHLEDERRICYDFNKKTTLLLWQVRPLKMIEAEAN